MEEYVITITDSDNETSNIKSFAETIEELVDNIVCLEYVKTIISVKRIRDNKTWNITTYDKDGNYKWKYVKGVRRL